MLSHFSRVQLFGTHGLQPARLLVHGIFPQEYWSGLPCPTPGDLPDPGIEPVSLAFPALTGTFLTTSDTREAWATIHGVTKSRTQLGTAQQKKE